MRIRTRDISIFRQVQGSRYCYYIQEGETTVQWYPEMMWQSRRVSRPEGKLLIEGTEEQVMFGAREVLPPDLYQEIRRSLEGDARGDGDDEELGQDVLQGGEAMVTADPSVPSPPLVDPYTVPVLVGAIVGILIYAFFGSVVWAGAGLAASALLWYWYRGRHA